MPPSTSSSDPEVYLQTLLQQLSFPSPPSLSPTDITHLSTSLLPSSPARARSLAYLVLSKSLTPPTPSPKISLLASIQAGVSDTEPTEILQSLALLTALLQVEPTTGTEIFNHDGLLDSIMDLVELPFFSTPLLTSQAALAIGELLSAASGVPKLRGEVIARSSKWLESNLAEGQGASISEVEEIEEAERNRDTLKIISAVTLTKLDRASAADPELKQSTSGGTDELAHLLSTVIISSSSTSPPTPTNESTLLSALEGLAYTSLSPSTKSHLSTPTFFFALIALSRPAPSRSTARSGLSPAYSKDLTSARETGESARAYGIVTILANLLGSPVRLSEEQKQIAQLKSMASGGGKGSSVPVEEAEEPGELQRRVQLALDAGVVGALGELVKVDSERVREGVGKVMLGLVEEQVNRPRVLQAGGGALLRRLASTLAGPPPKSSTTDTPDIPESALPTLQALSKLIITTAPSSLFHPSPETTSLDSIRPLTILLTHPSSTTLQHFEALMALTNLASLGPAPAARIVSLGMVRAAEEAMVGEHPMVRRAAVELVCNLTGGCEEAWNLYTGEGGGNQAAARSRLHVLLAMTDVEDLPTRLAATGALAGLTGSGGCCELLLGLGAGGKEAGRDGGKIMEMMELLFAPPTAPALEDADEAEEEITEISTLPIDPGLIHRASITLHNILLHIATLPPARRGALFSVVVESGVVGRLLDLLAQWTSEGAGGVGREAVEGVVGCLKVLKEGGVDIVKG